MIDLFIFLFSLFLTRRERIFLLKFSWNISFPPDDFGWRQLSNNSSGYRSSSERPNNKKKRNHGSCFTIYYTWEKRYTKAAVCSKKRARRGTHTHYYYYTTTVVPNDVIETSSAFKLYSTNSSLNFFYLLKNGHLKWLNWIRGAVRSDPFPFPVVSCVLFFRHHSSR